MSGEITKATSLVDVDEEQFALAIARIETEEQAEEFIAQVKIASDAVKRLKKLQHLRVKFTTIENKTYTHFYKCGFVEQLRQVNNALPNACKWFFSLDKSEQDNAISGESGPLVNQYRSALKKEKEREARKDLIDRAAYVREFVLSEYKKDGRTNISTDRIKDKLYLSPRFPLNDFEVAHAVSDFVDGLKDDLLKEGAYGIGGGDYVNGEDPYELTDALNIRITGVVRDIEAIERLLYKIKDDGLKIRAVQLNGPSSSVRRLDSYSRFMFGMLMWHHTSGVFRWNYATEKVREYAFLDALQVLGINIHGRDSDALLRALDKTYGTLFDERGVIGGNK